MLTITEGLLADDLTYEGIIVVSAKFHYPIVSGGNSKTAKKINSYYRQIVKTLMNKAQHELYPDAAEALQYSLEHDIPFRPFEAVMMFTVTVNNASILSLFYDVYEFTGGAHGFTKRFGDTWHSDSGWFIELCDLFPRGTNYRRLLIDNAMVTAARQITAGTHMYVEDYPRLMRKYFSSTKFYVFADSISIFYDQYAIAPGYEGTPVFDYLTDATLKP